MFLFVLNEVWLRHSTEFESDHSNLSGLKQGCLTLIPNLVKAQICTRSLPLLLHAQLSDLGHRNPFSLIGSRTICTLNNLVMSSELKRWGQSSFLLTFDDCKMEGLTRSDLVEGLEA